MRDKLKIARIAFISGVIVFVIGQWIFSDGFDIPFNELLLSFGIYQLYAFSITFVNIYFFDYLAKVSSLENQANKRILIGFLGSLVLTIIVLIALRFVVVVYIFGRNTSSFLNDSKGYFIFGITVTIITSLLFHIFYFYKALNEKKVKESQIVAKTESAKFESLKNQLDPHFLFNSLNVLTSLISENPLQAEKFTTKLSKVYRYVLEQKGKDLTALVEELKFAKSYMELLQMRFEDGIKFRIPNSLSNSDLKIVPLSLQLLLENAVKHNVISSEIPLEIRIYEENGFLVIENNINPKSSLEKSTKVGLKNIIQRYELVTNIKVEIINNNKIFKVRLPLLTQKIKMMRTDYINDSNKYIRAKKHVDDLKDFYGSLIAYFLVIPFLIFINYRTSWNFQWFWFPLFGWGLGNIIQAFKVYGYGANWEERKIRELMDKDNNR
jgi:sensor histidine kinase YesM